MSAEPLTREERDRILCLHPLGPKPGYHSPDVQLRNERWEATVQAERERAERLRGGIGHAMRSVHLLQALERLTEAIAADAARSEG